MLWQAQAAALKSVWNYVAEADMNAVPWPGTHSPPRKGDKDKTLHVTGSVLWMTKHKIALRLLHVDG